MKGEQEPTSLTKEYQDAMACITCGEKNYFNENEINDVLNTNCDNFKGIFSTEDTEFEKRRMGHPIYLVPDGTDVLKLITSFEISTSWFRAAKKDKIKFDFIFASSFGIISTLGLIAGIYSLSLFVVMFSLFFFIGAILLNYIFLANLINKTYITITENELQIRHKPLKFLSWKQHNIQIDEIKQLYIKEYETNRTVNNKPLLAYGLYLKKNKGDELRILEDMNRETSRYIEQEIEEFLHITDVSVSGEIKDKLLSESDQ